MNVICLISCTNCNEQYVGSALDFKKKFQNTQKTCARKPKVPGSSPAASYVQR